MNRSEVISSVVVDFVTINLTFLVYYALRVESGWIEYAIHPEFYLPMAALWIYWLLIFFLHGLYRSWYALSRLDELISIFRATVVGVLTLFFIIVLDDLATNAPTTSRMLIVGYWVLLVVDVSVGRMLLRYVQRRLLIAGIGIKTTVVVGWSDRAFQLCDMTLRSRALGYDVRGFITVPASGRRKPKAGAEYKGVPVLGDLSTLDEVIEQQGVQEVLVGLESHEHAQLMDVLRACNGRDVGIKIMADLYDIVTGQARVASLFGVPLLDIRPQIMQPWEEAAKRALDITVSLLILLLGAPVWLLISLLLKLDSPGPALYLQERVGKNGRLFRIIKFRSMVADAEKVSGPVWAGKNDPRVTRVGRLLRRMHLDEVPQFINVLVGDMSLVGPRPERPHFVESLADEIPLYRRRLKVRPGITGWAQVKHKYDESIDDVKAKVKYDLFYIENASWRFDMKILLNTLYVMLMRKGHS